jgi:hypothetical protein
MSKAAALFCMLAACGPRATYNKDIAPLVQDHCIGCHAAGGIAGIDLSSYAGAKLNAPLMKAVTSTRGMPPYLVDPSGTCGTFTPDGHLTDEQVALVSQWVDAGAPEGPGTSAVTPPQASPLEDAASVAMSEPYTPVSAAHDDYRCFVLDPMLAADRFLTGYEVHPGEPRTVHHVILFALDNTQADAMATQKDAGEPGYGYPCFGGSGVPSRPVAAWAPGTRVVTFPAGTGVRLIAGHKLVMQVHYNTHQGVFTDTTGIDLALAASVANEALIAGVADFKMQLEPGEADVATQVEMRLGDLGVPLGIFIRGVYPHMHTSGRSMRFEVDHEGTTHCVTQVPRWDFQFQRFYFFDTPLYVYPNDTLRVSCHYDTRDRTEVTNFGESTSDEMCLMGVYVTLF